MTCPTCRHSLADHFYGPGGAATGVLICYVDAHRVIKPGDPPACSCRNWPLDADQGELFAVQELTT